MVTVMRVVKTGVPLYHPFIGSWLVVSNMAFIFHNIWDVILPIDFHIFQRGRSTTIQPMIQDSTWQETWATAGGCQRFAIDGNCWEIMGNHEGYHGIVTTWLVVWNIFYFSIQLGIIIPTDFHIFQMGRVETTNQL